MKNGHSLLQHPLAFSRGIYPSAGGSEMSGVARNIPLGITGSQGINPQAES